MALIWKKVPGWEHYEVSELGTLRNDRFPHISRGRLNQPDKGGYRQLELHDRGRKMTVLVHRLVALTFIGPAPEGFDCCHNDGDSWNHHPSNLRYATRRSNMLDKKRHGTSLSGENNPRNKYSRQTIEKVLELSDRGVSYGAIQEATGVSRLVAWSVVNGRSWKHLRPGYMDDVFVPDDHSGKSLLEIVDGALEDSPEGVDLDVARQTAWVYALEGESWGFNRNQIHWRVNYIVQNLTPESKVEDIELSHPLEFDFNIAEACDLKDAMDRLKPRTRQILYGLLLERRTLEDVGEDLNLTRERVRQIRESALSRVRQWLRR